MLGQRKKRPPRPILRTSWSEGRGRAGLLRARNLCARGAHQHDEPKVRVHPRVPRPNNRLPKARLMCRQVQNPQPRRAATRGSAAEFRMPRESTMRRPDRSPGARRLRLSLRAPAKNPSRTCKRLRPGGLFDESPDEAGFFQKVTGVLRRAVKGTVENDEAG